MKKHIVLMVSIVLLSSCNSSEKKTTGSNYAVYETSKVRATDLTTTTPKPPSKDLEKAVLDVPSETKIEDPKLKASMSRGKTVYSDFCISCHLPTGKGVAKVFPPLANSDYLLSKQTESIKSIKYGQTGKITVNGVTYNSAMPALGLEDKEIADVMNYILNSWGNSNAKLITAEQVSKIKN